MVQVTVPAFQVQPNTTDLTYEISIIAEDHSLIQGEKDPYRTMQNLSIPSAFLLLSLMLETCSGVVRASTPPCCCDAT